MYGGTNGALRTIISKLGVEVTWVTSNSVEEYRKSVKSNTKVRREHVVHELEREWSKKRGIKKEERRVREEN